MLALGGLAGSVAAQDASVSEIEVDPVTGQRYVRTRPEGGLRRGALEVPAWVPIGLGISVLVVAGAAVGGWVFRRRRRGRREPSR